MHKWQTPLSIVQIVIHCMQFIQTYNNLVENVVDNNNNNNFYSMKN